MTVQYRQSFVAALTGHAVLILAVLIVSAFPGWFRPKPVDVPILWLPPTTTEPLQRRAPPPEHPVPPPPAVEPTEPKTPETPPDPVPPRAPAKPVEKPEPDDAIPIKSVVQKPVEHTKPTTSNDAAHVTSPHVPVKLGPVVSRPVTSSGPPSHKPLHFDKRDWDTMMGVNAPIGHVDSIPMDERQRCMLLIKRALYDAWDQPASADAGLRPAGLEIHLDLSGRISSYTITQSSGSPQFDRTVLLAAKAVPQVEGLSTSFLKEYSRLTVEFKLSE